MRRTISDVSDRRGSREKTVVRNLDTSSKRPDWHIPARDSPGNRSSSFLENRTKNISTLVPYRYTSKFSTSSKHDSGQINGDSSERRGDTCTNTSSSNTVTEHGTSRDGRYYKRDSHVPADTTSHRRISHSVSLHRRISNSDSPNRRTSHSDSSNRRTSHSDSPNRRTSHSDSVVTDYRSKSDTGATDLARRYENISLRGKQHEKSYKHSNISVSKEPSSSHSARKTPRNLAKLPVSAPEKYASDTNRHSVKSHWSPVEISSVLGNKHNYNSRQSQKNHEQNLDSTIGNNQDSLYSQETDCDRQNGYRSITTSLPSNKAKRQDNQSSLASELPSDVPSRCDDHFEAPHLIRTDSTSDVTGSSSSPQTTEPDTSQIPETTSTSTSDYLTESGCSSQPPTLLRASSSSEDFDLLDIQLESADPNRRSCDRSYQYADSDVIPDLTVDEGGHVTEDMALQYDRSDRMAGRQAGRQTGRHAVRQAGIRNT